MRPVEPRIASFADEPGGPSWSAALDRVFRSWIEGADVEGAARALSAMAAALPGLNVSESAARLGGSPRPFASWSAPGQPITSL